MGLFTRRTGERERRDELLSAYLDGQLGTGERARLEAQLATDPALRAELEALRHTVALVRDLPQVPIPCNFILLRTVGVRPRPALSARSRRAWAAPLLTAATAVVSLLFVVVLAGDLLLSGVGGRAFAPAAQPLMETEAPRVALEPSPGSEEVVAQVEVEKVVPAATPLPTVAEVPLEAVASATAEAEHYAVETPEDIVATVPVEGDGLIEEPAAPALTSSPPVAEEAVAAPAAPATPEGVAATMLAGGGGPIEESAALAPSPGPIVGGEAAAAPTALATATVMPERGMGSAEPTPSEVGEAAPRVVGGEEPETAEGGPGAPESEVAELATISPWQAPEVILGLTALGLALATIWAWRVRRQ